MLVNGRYNQSLTYQIATWSNTKFSHVHKNDVYRLNCHYYGLISPRQTIHHDQGVNIFCYIWWERKGAFVGTKWLSVTVHLMSWMTMAMTMKITITMTMRLIMMIVFCVPIADWLGAMLIWSYISNVPYSLSYFYSYYFCGMSIV